MAGLPDDPSNPKAAEFDRDAITDFDRDTTPLHDPDATTGPDRDGAGDHDADATGGFVASPGVAAETMAGRPHRPTTARAANGLGLPATRSWACWAPAVWGSCTRRATFGSSRLVALKMIKVGGGAGPEDLARFEAEARAVAAIDHPNIIKIFEIGEHDGLPYFSLEFLEGGSLAQGIAGKPQPIADAARIVETLARAMDVAHRRGIVHRDIKPANVLLAGDGTPKIADFGLVKRLEADSGQTGTGSILGSPSYMAPEQTTGAEKAGPAADQYALGATLYEMLTGRPPFRGSSILDTLDLIRTAEPVAPSQLLPRMPRDLETICLKALQKDAARRYPDVAAMAEDLRRFRAGEPIVARPISGPERAWRWCRRNPAVTLLLAAVAASLLLGMAGTSYYAIQAGNREQDTLAYAQRLETEKRVATDAGTPPKAPWPRRTGKRASSLRSSDGSTSSNRTNPTRRTCEASSGTTCSACAGSTCAPCSATPLPSAAWPSVRTADCSRPPPAIMANQGKSRSGTWRREGSAFACTGHKDLVSCVAFSPDGRRLASANGGVCTPGEIKLWDTANGRELLGLPAHATPVWGLAFSPDGRQLASFGRGVAPTGSVLPCEVKVWDAAGGRQLLCIPGNEAAAVPTASVAVAFSPAAAEPRRRLAFADGRYGSCLRCRHGKRTLPPGQAPVPGQQRGVQPRRPAPRLGQQRWGGEGLGRGHGERNPGVSTGGWSCGSGV